jgi:hypothetical protein
MSRASEPGLFFSRRFFGRGIPMFTSTFTQNALKRVLSIPNRKVSALIAEFALSRVRNVTVKRVLR